jgi:hypothetical protein
MDYEKSVPSTTLIVKCYEQDKEEEEEEGGERAGDMF